MSKSLNGDAQRPAGCALAAGSNLLPGNDLQMGVTGLEPDSDPSGIPSTSTQGAAESGAVTALFNQELIEVLQAWEVLPDAVKNAITQLVTHHKPTS